MLDDHPRHSIEGNPSTRKDPLIRPLTCGPRTMVTPNLVRVRESRPRLVLNIDDGVTTHMDETDDVGGTRPVQIHGRRPNW